MAWVKIRVPRTSQPQDTCGIDWSNPITAGLAVVRTGKELYGSREGEGAAVTVGPIGLQVGGNSVRYPLGEVPTEGITLFQLARFGSVIGISSLNICTGSTDGIGFKNNTTSIRLLNYIGAGANTITISSKTLPINTPVAVCGTYDGATQRIYQAGEQTGSTSKTGALVLGASPTLNLGANFADASFTGGTCALLLYYTRALPAAEVKSLTDNPWQIFEPEEITIWVPDAVGAGGAATVIPIGVQANSAIGTPAAIGAAIAALTGVSATGSVGSPTATGGASIPATASPSGVSASSAVGTPAAKGAAKALPAGVQATSAVGTPLAIGGSSIPATVLPAGVAGLAYVGSPVATGQARAYPLGVQATGAVGSPVVTAGGSAVAQPQGVAASSSVGAPVARGAAVAYPLGLAGYWSVGQPVAIGQSAMPATAYPAGVSATGYVGTPVAFEASDATPSIHRAISPAQSYTATSPAQSYTAVVPAQIYST